jgi:hypothetical protein
VDPTSPLSGCLCIERAPALPNSEEDGPFAVPYALNGSAAVELSSALGAPGGIAAFDANGLVRSDQLPAPAGANETVLVFMGVFNATSDSAGLSNETACTPGEYYIVSSGGNLTLGTYPVVASEWQTGDSLVCMHHCNNTSGGGNSSVGIANCTAAERFASWTRIPNPYKHPPPRIYKAHWYMEEAAPSSSSAGAVLPARYAVHGSWLWATSLGQSPAYAQRTLTLPSAQDVLLQNPYKRRGDYIELDALFAVEDAAASVCLAMGEGLAFTGAHSPPFDASLCVHGPSAMWHVRLRLTIAANPSSQTGLRIVVQPILALPVSSSPWHARA